MKVSWPAGGNPKVTKPNIPLDPTRTPKIPSKNYKNILILGVIVGLMVPPGTPAGKY